MIEVEAAYLRDMFMVERTPPHSTVTGVTMTEEVAQMQCTAGPPVTIPFTGWARTGRAAARGRHRAPCPAFRGGAADLSGRPGPGAAVERVARRSGFPSRTPSARRPAPATGGGSAGRVGRTHPAHRRRAGSQLRGTSGQGRDAGGTHGRHRGRLLRGIDTAVKVQRHPRHVDLSGERGRLSGGFAPDSDDPQSGPAPGGRRRRVRAAPDSRACWNGLEDSPATSRPWWSCASKAGGRSPREPRRRRGPSRSAGTETTAVMSQACG